VHEYESDQAVRRVKSSHGSMSVSEPLRWKKLLIVLPMSHTSGSSRSSSGIVRWSKTRGPRRLPARYTPGAHSPALAAALRLHRHGEHTHAVTAYADAIAEGPADVEAWMGLGVCAAFLGHASIARAALVTAGRLREALDGSNIARMLRDRGCALLAIGDVDEGLASLADAVRAAPDDVALALVLAESLHEHGAVDQAVAHAAACVEHAPTMPEAHFVFGRVTYERAPERALDRGP
jgi:Flp pilus assembly protein TadD